MTTNEIIRELRKMQSQIIHGTDFFGVAADKMEFLMILCSRAHNELDKFMGGSDLPNDDSKLMRLMQELATNRANDEETTAKAKGNP